MGTLTVDERQESCVYLKPLVDTLGVELVSAGQDPQGLADLEIAHANDASRLIVFRTITRISEKINDIGVKLWISNLNRTH